MFGMWYLQGQPIVRIYRQAKWTFGCRHSCCPHHRVSVFRTLFVAVYAKIRDSIVAMIRRLGLYCRWLRWCQQYIAPKTHIHTLNADSVPSPAFIVALLYLEFANVADNFTVVKSRKSGFQTKRTGIAHLCVVLLYVFIRVFRNVTSRSICWSKHKFKFWEMKKKNNEQISYI